MNVKIHGEDSLRTASDAFVTFLYAAAVHLVIAHFAFPGPMKSGMGLVVLLFVLFLFSDWLSRVRLPWQLPPSDEIGITIQLAKTLLEVGGLYFLVLAWLTSIANEAGHPIPALMPPPAAEGVISIVNEAGQAIHNTSATNQATLWEFLLSPYMAFAGFLLATFLWNMFMLLAMKKLSWFQLVRVGLNGTALDLPEAAVYAKHFWKWRERFRGEAAGRIRPGIDYTAQNLGVGAGFAIKEAPVRSGAQVVAFHLTWSSLVAGIAILLGDLYLNKPVAVAIFERLEKEGELFVAAIYLSIFVIVCIGVFFLERSQQRLTRLIYAAILFAFILLASAVRFRLSKYLPETLYINILLWFTALFVLPIVPYFIAPLCHSAGGARRFFLWVGGALGTVVLLLLYLSIDIKILMITVAVEQVLVNIFLQYAASDRPIKVHINPTKVILTPGEGQRFEASVTGSPDDTVLWRTTCGSITDEGLYTAPAQIGKYHIYAISNADSSRVAEAVVITTEGIQPTDVADAIVTAH